MAERQNPTGEALSNEELAHCLLRVLIEWYSASGHSSRRSMRAAIVEAVVRLMPDLRFSGGEDYYACELIDKGKSRLIRCTPLQPLLFDESFTEEELCVTCLPLSLLLPLALSRVREWYECLPENRALPSEYNLLCLALRLFGPQPTLPAYSWETLLFECEERWHTRFYAKHGIVFPLQS